MRMNVDGDSINTMHSHYRNARIFIFEKIEDAEKNTILNSDIEQLVKFYTHEYILPQIKIDDSKKPIVEDETSSRSSQLQLKVGIPLILEEGVDIVVGLSSSTQLMGIRYSLENGYLISRVHPYNNQNVPSYVENRIEELNTVIKYKNQDIPSLNSRLKEEVKQKIIQMRTKLESDKSALDGLAEKLSVEIIKKSEGNIVPDLTIKERVKVLMPEPRKRIEPEIQSETVNKVVEVIKNHCRQFEVTPKGFSKLVEEELRDVILANLNSHFEPIATGETFVKRGKTDIHLKLNIDGGILSAECKFWGGQKKYQETIEQHFRYLTWSQDYAIQITFSKNKGFSNVIEEAIEAATSHETYIQNSVKKIDKNCFVTTHRFPEDSNKKITIHHILVNMYLE